MDLTVICFANLSKATSENASFLLYTPIGSNNIKESNTQKNALQHIAAF